MLSGAENEKEQGTESHIDPIALRAELKHWENAFRHQHGRRAAREDIKADDTIQAKYKLFNSLTRPTSKAQHITTERLPSATPRRTEKRANQLAIPHPIVSPTQELEPTPAFIRNALGPTPHRDGRVLGIFDMMEEEETPQKDAGPTNVNGHACVAGTPSKSTARSSDLAHSRTPQSSSKRYFLDLFAGTPLKRKRDERDVGTGSSSKRKFATPSFLRRTAPLARIAEDDAESTNMAPPFKRRGLVRSLSSMIQGLRKHEDDRMDDEWDVLNEIEEEEEGGRTRKKEAPKILVEDSQAVEMPLGPDKGIESSEESGPEVEKVRKLWKKKGQKRTTKRTNMRPVLHKAKNAEEDLEDSDDDGGGKVADNQQIWNGEDDAFDGSDHEDAKTKYLKEAAKKRELASEDRNNNGKKKRKIDPNAISHANFRALKIKNKNSKGKGGGGRFGRR